MSDNLRAVVTRRLHVQARELEAHDDAEAAIGLLLLLAAAYFVGRFVGAGGFPALVG